MRIDKIIFNNFRIYKGINEVNLHDHKERNISLIAGKNGFGKTTFLTALIWNLYGNLITQVEDKYRIDIKNAGGYDNFLESLLNRKVKRKREKSNQGEASFSTELHLIDVMIPSIPCKKVVIKRSYDFVTKKEELRILIDGYENELTKEVGYEIFINDFILPREIAKFFFFDAEKIVSLAEAKSKSELKSLSRAYSEVLGIKKYEDLKHNLNTLLTKLRRGGVSKHDKVELDRLIDKSKQFNELIENNLSKQSRIEDEIIKNRILLDSNQEKLIREGNEISLDELKEMKDELALLKVRHHEAKGELKKLMEIVPIVIGFNKLTELIDQINLEFSLKNNDVDSKIIEREIEAYSKRLLNEFKKLNIDKKLLTQLQKVAINQVKSKKSKVRVESSEILLDLADQDARKIISVYNYIKDSFRSQFKIIVKNEKDCRLKISRLKQKIRQAEARKENPLAIKLREDSEELENKNAHLANEKEELIAEMGALRIQYSTNEKTLSEYEKNYKLIALDKKKYDVTVEVLKKLNTMTNRIKEEKKYSLQKSILLGLNKLMHKNAFIHEVQVRIENEVMDIDLLDENKNLIDKDSLSKGEQQLYATALLKALVDESGINFPVFIDSPLQKFDKQHSTNVIQQFYPSISDQVVLFPLLEKELSLDEYDLLKDKLNGVYLIENNNNESTINEHALEDLFIEFNKQNYVLSN